MEGLLPSLHNDIYANYWLFVFVSLYFNTLNVLELCLLLFLYNISVTNQPNVYSLFDYSAQQWALRLVNKNICICICICFLISSYQNRKWKYIYFLYRNWYTENRFDLVFMWLVVGMWQTKLFLIGKVSIHSYIKFLNIYFFPFLRENNFTIVLMAKILLTKFDD